MFRLFGNGLCCVLFVCFGALHFIVFERGKQADAGDFMVVGSALVHAEQTFQAVQLAGKTNRAVFFVDFFFIATESCQFLAPLLLLFLAPPEQASYGGQQN